MWQTIFFHGCSQYKCILRWKMHMVTKCLPLNDNLPINQWLLLFDPLKYSLPRLCLIPLLCKSSCLRGSRSLGETLIRFLFMVNLYDCPFCYFSLTVLIPDVGFISFFLWLPSFFCSHCHSHNNDPALSNTYFSLLPLYTASSHLSAHFCYPPYPPVYNLCFQR